MQIDELETDLQVQFEALRDRVRKHCYRMLNNADNADDAAQDTLANAWDKRSTYRRDSPLEHWVMRIATNTCLDFVRRRRAQPTIDFDETRSPQPSCLDPGLRSVELRLLLSQVLTPLLECMGDQNFWIWQQKVMGVTEEEISLRLPPQWKLSRDGVHSRVQRNIRACLDKIRAAYGNESSQALM